MQGQLEPEAASAVLGSTPEEVRLLWRSLGLSAPGHGLVEEDLQALRLLLDVVADLGGGADLAESLARSLGQHAERLATWQAIDVVEAMRVRPVGREEAAELLERRVLPRLEQLLLVLWRRHVARVLHWRAGRLDEDAHRLTLSVGFVDLVDWTARTTALDGREVLLLVRAFERTCAEVVARHRGRVVKTLGDEILFVTDDASEALDIGLDMAERAAQDDLLVAVRIGVATGAVGAASGDVHGPVVNLAHRLTQDADPGQVLVDAVTAAAAATEPDLRVDAVGPRALRGLGTVPCWQVRRGAQV